MKTIKIKLDSIDKVKEFVTRANSYTGKIQLSSGKYTVDGKSVMGIYSLDLKDELILEIEPGENLSEFMCELQPYMTV